MTRRPSAGGVLLRAPSLAAEPDHARTRAYIDRAWDTLARRVE